MELFGKMELNTYLCRAKKERDGLRHQRYITQTGYRTLPEFAKKETLRIIPQQFQARQHDTVQLTYPPHGRWIPRLGKDVQHWPGECRCPGISACCRLCACVPLFFPGPTP